MNLYQWKMALLNSNLIYYDKIYTDIWHFLVSIAQTTTKREISHSKLGLGDHDY